MKDRIIKLIPSMLLFTCLAFVCAIERPQRVKAPKPVYHQRKF